MRNGDLGGKRNRWLLLLVVAAALATPVVGQEYVQDGQFRMSWGNDVLPGKPAAWSSNKGVLYWLTDAEDPEGLVTIRRRGDHWQLSVAALIEAKSTLYAVHNETNAMWAVRTGRAQEVVQGYSGFRPDALVTCIIPRGATRRAWRCYWGLSLRIDDAWTLDGEIPAHYFAPGAASDSGGSTPIEPPTGGGSVVGTSGGSPDS